VKFAKAVNAYCLFLGDKKAAGKRRQCLRMRRIFYIVDSLSNNGFGLILGLQPLME
jgi:hypothetical protein